MKLDVTRILGLGAVAIALLMTIISVVTDDSVFPNDFGKRVVYQTAYWPGHAYKIEDGKYFAKKPHSLIYRPVSRDEYDLTVKRDYRDVWRTYYTDVMIVGILAIPFAFPELMREQSS